MADAHKNFAYSTVATAPSPASSGTSLVVAAADGAKFPAAPFNATVWPVGVQPTTTNAEIVRVTAISTDTFTIVRAQESSSARTVVVGDQIAATVTAKAFTDIETLLALLPVANGGTGAATLTNHGVVLGQGTAAVAITAAGTTDYPLVSNGASADPAFEQLSLTTAVTGTLPVANGGTGSSTAAAARTALGLDTGWLAETGTFIYGSATQFAIATDLTARYPKGTKISYNDGAVDYGVVFAVSYLPASPVTPCVTTVATSLFTLVAHGLVNGIAVVPTGLVNTTGITNGAIYFVVGVTANTFQLAATIGGAAITLGGTADTTVTITGATRVVITGGTDYSIANAALTAPRYSFAANPQGYPGWFNYTPTFTGYSADPTTLGYQFRVDGNVCTYCIRDGANGTSNATSITMTLPITAATVTNGSWFAPTRYVDNSVAGTALGSALVLSAGIVVTCYKDGATGAWTNSGGKRIGAATLVYPI